LVPGETRFDPATASDWTFEIVADDGSVVRSFDRAHGELSHLVLVRRDLTHFQHRHPSLSDDGTWLVRDLELPEPGVYRAFVDIVVDGHPTTLGYDLFVPGPTTLAPRPTSSTSTHVDGYDVDLHTDDLALNERARLPFEFRRGDDIGTTLGQYLGARGHLVALREGDLGYLHVHPEASDADTQRVSFGVQFPTPGRYRLFLQARPDEHLVTAQFDVRLPEDS
jgi:hypothetical protein